jgi:hypothetical protein
MPLAAAAVEAASLDRGLDLPPATAYARIGVSGMVMMWGLADFFVDEVVEFYPSREAAQRALENVLADEPSWEGMLAVLPVKLFEFCPN